MTQEQAFAEAYVENISRTYWQRLPDCTCFLINGACYVCVREIVDLTLSKLSIREPLTTGIEAIEERIASLHRFQEIAKEK